MVSYGCRRLQPTSAGLAAQDPEWLTAMFDELDDDGGGERAPRAPSADQPCTWKAQMLGGAGGAPVYCNVYGFTNNLQPSGVPAQRACCVLISVVSSRDAPRCLVARAAAVN